MSTPWWRVESVPPQLTPWLHQDLEETIRQRVCDIIARVAREQYHDIHPERESPSFSIGVLCVSTLSWLDNKYIPDIPLGLEARVINPHPGSILPINRPQLRIRTLSVGEYRLSRSNVMEFFIAGPYDHPDLQGYDMTYSVMTRPARHVTNVRTDSVCSKKKEEEEHGIRFEEVYDITYTDLEASGAAWPNQITFDKIEGDESSEDHVHPSIIDYKSLRLQRTNLALPRLYPQEYATIQLSQMLRQEFPFMGRFGEVQVMSILGPESFHPILPILRHLFNLYYFNSTNAIPDDDEMITFRKNIASETLHLVRSIVRLRGYYYGLTNQQAMDEVSLMM